MPPLAPILSLQLKPSIARPLFQLQPTPKHSPLTLQYATKASWHTLQFLVFGLASSSRPVLQFIPVPVPIHSSPNSLASKFFNKQSFWFSLVWFLPFYLVLPIFSFTRGCSKQLAAFPIITRSRTSPSPFTYIPLFYSPDNIMKNKEVGGAKCQLPL